MNKITTVLVFIVSVLITGAFVLAARPEAALKFEAIEHAEALPAPEILGVAAENSTIIKTASQVPMGTVRPKLSKPIARCVNIAGAMDAPNEGDWGYRIRQKDMRIIRETGFDTVRLPVRFSVHTQTRAPYKIDPDILARTDEVIRQALDQGLNVMLDVHNYDELMENPRVHVPRLKAMWEQLATRYANWPDGLMFELINEPHTKLSVADMNRLNEELLSQVRRTNPTRWVIVSSGNWGGIYPLLPDAPVKFTPPRDPHVIATFHYYDDMDFTHQGAHFVDPPIPTGKRFGSRAELAKTALDMRHVGAFQESAGVPVLLGEFGVYRKVPADQRAKWTAHVRREAEAQGMGWCYWEWATEFKMYNTKTEQFVPGLKEALFQ